MLGIKNCTHSFISQDLSVEKALDEEVEWATVLADIAVQADNNRLVASAAHVHSLFSVLNVTSITHSGH